MWFTYSQLLPCHSVLKYQCQASPFGKRAVGNGGGVGGVVDGSCINLLLGSKHS